MKYRTTGLVSPGGVSLITGGFAILLIKFATSEIRISPFIKII